MVNIKSSILPLTGLSCTNCARADSTNVSKLQGISEDNVDFASEKPSISFDLAQISEKEIIGCIYRSGYGVATWKIELPDMGLQDNTDALTMEKFLLKQNGLIDESIRLVKNRLIIKNLWM